MMDPIRQTFITSLLQNPSAEGISRAGEERSAAGISRAGEERSAGISRDGEERSAAGLSRAGDERSAAAIGSVSDRSREEGSRSFTLIPGVSSCYSVSTEGHFLSPDGQRECGVKGQGLMAGKRHPLSSVNPSLCLSVNHRESRAPGCPRPRRCDRAGRDTPRRTQGQSLIVIKLSPSTIRPALYTLPGVL